MFRKNKSYRDCPITIKTIRDGVHLNVRKSFGVLEKSPMAKKNKLEHFKVKNVDDASLTITLEDMTAAEYANDLRAYYGTHHNKLRDILYIETFRAAILDNAHLFRDKVISFNSFCEKKLIHEVFVICVTFYFRLWLTFDVVWVFCQCSVH